MSFADELVPLENNFQLFPSTLRTDLVLPPCIWTKENICTRTSEQENTILEIYLGYTLAMKHRSRIEKILNFDSELLDLNKQTYHIALTTIDDQSAYTEHLLERLEVYEKQAKDVHRKGVIKNIIWTTSGIGIGILAGILIGIFGI